MTRVVVPSTIQPDEGRQNVLVRTGFLVARLAGWELVVFRSHLGIEERAGRLVVDGGHRRRPVAKKHKASRPSRSRHLRFFSHRVRAHSAPAERSGFLGADGKLRDEIVLS